MIGWQLISTAPRDDGWISRALFAIRRPWGWEMWVGQCDAGTIWLGRADDGSCFDTEAPTHWRPLPEPPSPFWDAFWRGMFWGAVVGLPAGVAALIWFRP